MVIHRDLVMQEVLVCLIEIEALLEDRLVVVMQRQAGSVVVARPLETAGLHFEHVIAAVTILIDPSANGIAGERWLELLGPIASIGEDAAGMLAFSTEAAGFFQFARRLLLLRNFDGRNFCSRLIHFLRGKQRPDSDARETSRICA